MACLYKLIYFDSRGRGEVARLLFALSGTQYHDERVASAAWPELKPRMPYGQLPVLEYDGKHYCQSDAINRFLARQFSLYGKDVVEGLEIDQILGVTNDVYGDYVKVNYYLKGEEQEKGKEKLISETVPKYIAYLAKQLGSNHFLVGNKVSLADVVVYDFVGDKIPSLVKDWKSVSPAVDDLVQRVSDIEHVKAYISSRS